MQVPSVACQFATRVMADLLVARAPGELLATIRKLAPVQRQKLYRRAPSRLALPRTVAVLAALTTKSNQKDKKTRAAFAAR
jgi:hypothetical protein